MDLQQELPGGRTLFVGLLFYALLIGLTAFRGRPPAAKPADAPASEFSGTRAKNVLEQLVGDGVPHPVGSAADSAVRERIIAELTRLGYQPKIESGFACDEWGTCAEVKNIVAILDGQETGPAVMMASHYDSVAAGPGASDDGAGVAAELEVARALKVSPKLRHPVIFLFDEGEEAGLLGAEVFVKGDPRAKDVKAVVNVEARGTSGPTAMFETGSANRWLMGLYASAVRRPSTSSINYTVYKLLPNDTDFTVFKRPGVGYQGFNFAFIGGVAHYHTPLDNVANTDVRSIQHQGQSALAALRSLADSNLNPPGDAEAVFFDLLGWKTIWWPAGWTIAFAGIAFVLLVIEIIVLMRRGELCGKSLILGVLSWPAMLVAAGTLGACLYFFLRKGGSLPVSWVADPGPMLAAAWASGVLVVSLLALAFWRAAGFFGFWAGTWAWWALISVALALTFPGLSYVFTLPSLVAALCGLWAVFAKGQEGWRRAAAVIVPGLVAGALGFPQAWFVYDALGAIVVTGIALFIALLVTPLAPVLGGTTRRARWAVPILAFAAFAVHAVMALEAPPYSANSPERMNFEYYQDSDTGKAHWLATPNSGILPQALRTVTPFSINEEIVQPLVGKAFVANAPALALAPPTLTIEKATPMQDKVGFQALLRTPRGAPEIIIGFPPDSGVESVSMNGLAIPEIRPSMLAYTHGWRAFICDTVPAEGVELQFVLPRSKPVSILLLDKSYGLPPEGAFLEKARPNTTIASQDGDAIIVSQHVTLKPQA